ncbi:MAG: hypothetical protein WBC33_01600, partial [Conexibacter sp.]
MYRLMLSVDGEQVAREVVDAAGGTCADVEPGNDDSYEFGAPQPCPLDASGQIAFDTATLPDGAHAIRLSVEDAAGNTTVLHDATVQTHNAPILTAAPALGGVARVGGQLSASTGQWDGAPTGYDYRWLRCDADGDHCAGIAGADAPSYAPTSADAYRRLRVEVTAANASGATSAQSAAGTRVADAEGRTEPVVGGAASPPGGSGSQPAPGGIVGLANPLAQVGGHVANGTGAHAQAQLRVGFQRADGRLVRRVSSASGRRRT